MKIALDMDEVIVDFVGGLLARVNSGYGSTLVYEDVTQWDMGPLLNPVLGVPWWGWLADRADAWSDFPPVPGALDGIQALKSAGCYLDIVTSKPEWARHTVWEWLAKHRPPVDGVTIVEVGDPKHEVSAADLLIDDNLDNCAAWASTGRAAWFEDAPWNRSQTPDGVTRVRDWAEIVGRLT